MVCNTAVNTQNKTNARSFIHSLRAKKAAVKMYDGSADERTLLENIYATRFF